MGIIVMHGKHLVSTRHSINADFPSLDQGVERWGWGRSEGIGTPSRDPEGPWGLGPEPSRLSRWARSLPPFGFSPTLTSLLVPGKGAKV